MIAVYEGGKRFSLWFQDVGGRLSAEFDGRVSLDVSASQRDRGRLAFASRPDDELWRRIRGITGHGGEAFG
ncbi:hypothetical protein SAMN05428950_101125 [Sphingomonas sp. OV641]|uniref:hypothetical protein n=1 Tax=Sphingomonas sp. OV641 TaxID=1881068 RepID=UPI0008D579EB|nr:hypothetical protein [Sphingomonas sp. OV641]SEI75647.1 hypothetical protein SAMN05428950_101125 [Sphingomonas sp. OV641]